MVIVGLVFAYKAITENWLNILVTGFVSPVIWAFVRGHSAQSKLYSEFLSEVNKTQVIANNQKAIKENIILEKLKEKQRSGK